MRKMILMAALAMLAGCGGASRTPLTRTLAALRSGDHDAIAAAKTDAEAETKTAVQPDGDLCQVSMADIEKYGVVYAIGKLDYPEVFAMPEEARYVYALTWAGKEMAIPPGSFLERAPVYRSARGEKPGELCVGKRNPIEAMVAGGPYRQDMEEARRVFLQGWMHDMKAKYGDAYDDRMRTAVNRLRDAGFHATWPAEYDFVEQQ